MRPLFGRLKVSTRLMSVLFPAPDEPTRAVVEPAGAWNDTCCSTSRPATYSKVTSSNRTSPTTSLSGGRAPSAASSVVSNVVGDVRFEDVTFEYVAEIGRAHV